MDLFSLALKIKTDGLSDAKKGLAEVETAGRKAGQSFDQLSGKQNQFASATTQSTAGINQLRGGLQNFTSQVLNTNPAISRVASTLSEFAVGGAITVGVLGGVAAISLAFRDTIQVWKDAEKANKDLIDSLASQTRHTRESGDEALRTALKFAKANLTRVQGGSSTPGLAGQAFGALSSPFTMGAFGALGQGVKAATELQNALDAVAAAEQNVAARADDMREKRMAADKAMLAFNEGADAILKGIDDRRKREAEEAQRRLDERIDTLSKAMSIEDLRGKATQQLQSIEASLSRIIDAGNIPLQRRVELEERLARVRAGLATPGLSPLATGPTVSVTPQNEAGAFPSGPMPNVPASRVKDLPPLINESGKVAVNAMQNLQNQMQAAVGSLSQVLGDGIYNAFAAAFNGEGLGGIFKAFSKTVLAGIGDIFGMMGRAYIQYGVIMSGLVPSLSNPFTAGPAAIAIGVGLEALSAALGAIGRRETATGGGFNNRHFGQGTVEMTRLKFVNRPGALADDVNPRQPVINNFTIIGPNDGAAQQQISRLLQNAHRKGYDPYNIGTIRHRLSMK